MMTAAELQARAHARAYDEHLYIRAVPRRPGYYTTRSRTNPHRRYSLVYKDGEIGCSCAGFYYRRSCKHAEALRNRLAREGVVVAPTAVHPDEPLAFQPLLAAAS